MENLLTNLLMVRAIIFLKNKLCTEMNYAANIFFHIFTIVGLTVVAIVKNFFFWHYGDLTHKSINGESYNFFEK